MARKVYISGWFIGENICLIYDILFESKQKSIPGLLVSIDFQQAFDSLSGKFKDKTLDCFSFGPSFKKGIKLFQKGKNLVYYKMVSCQTTFVYREAAGKGIHYHHIFLFYVWKF